jgi:predicted DNA-binding transcriptional regulator YafY
MLEAVRAAVGGSLATMGRTGTTAETLHRQWTLLQLIPRAPRKIDTARLERLLAQQGIEVSRRSIQRTLESLSQQFLDLRRDDSTKPYGWCWDRKGPLLEVPGMSLDTAVTYQLLERHLVHIMPRSTIESLRPHFNRAREVLAQQPDAKMTRWARKVRVEHQGQPRLVPNVKEAVLRNVSEALLEERRLEVRYRKRGEPDLRDYEVSPLGLVLRDGHLILVAAFWDYDDANQMLLHRMAGAEVLERRIHRPKGFDLDAYIAEGELGFRKGGPLELRLRIDERLVVPFEEAPLSADQVISGSGAWRKVTATVTDTVALRTWLRGHGAMVEVLGPKTLRAELAAEAEATAALYR